MLRKTAQTHGSIFDAHLHALKITFHFFLLLHEYPFQNSISWLFFFWIGFLPWIFVLNKELWESHWIGKGKLCDSLYVISKGQIPISHIPKLSPCTRKNHEVPSLELAKESKQQSSKTTSDQGKNNDLHLLPGSAPSWVNKVVP